MTALIVDFDDTLVVTRSARVSLVLEVLSAMGINGSRRALDDRWGDPFQKLIVAAAPELRDDRRFTEFEATYRQAVSVRPWVPRRGAVDFIGAASRASVAVHIVSSSSRALVAAGLRQLDPQATIRSVWTSEDTQFHKPDPRVLLPLLDLIARSSPGPIDALAIGDSVEDYAVARFHQIPFIAIEGGSSTRAQFSAMGLSTDCVHDDLQSALATEPLASLLKR